TIAVATGTTHFAAAATAAPGAGPRTTPDPFLLPAPDLAAGEYAYLEVRDTGSGIAEEIQSRIFEPFFTTKFTGRGLGLAAALGIVRGHKGALKVSSETGKGSRFEILFPLSSQPLRKPQPAPEEITRRATTSAGHILVVDDEELVRRTARCALERYGFTVLLSENGQRAVDVFAGLSDQIALVLLDLT